MFQSCLIANVFNDGVRCLYIAIDTKNNTANQCAGKLTHNNTDHTIYTCRRIFTDYYICCCDGVLTTFAACSLGM